MAIIQELTRRSLVIYVEDGVTAEGNTRIKSRTYGDIKENSTVENLYAAANALASLMAAPLSSIALSDRSELVEE